MEVNVKMPRLGVNDEFVTLVEWLTENGSRISAGESIATIETTKETSEIKADCDGYVHFLVDSDSEVRIEDVVAVITDSAEYISSKEEDVCLDMQITEKAKALIKKHQIDLSLLPKKNIIREKDVMDILVKNDTVVRSKANDVVIVCGGGLAKMTIDLLRLNKAFNIHGIVDDNPKIGPEVLGVPYLGTLSELDKIKSDGYLTAVNANGSITIDNTSDSFYRRKNIFEKIKNAGYFLPTMIHPSAEIAPSAQLGEGILVFENAVIGSDALIGDNCIINTGSIISHDCKIGNHCRVSPGAVLAGDVTVGENTLIGMGVTVYLGVHIGKNVIIANGKNIMTDIPDNTIVK